MLLIEMMSFRDPQPFEKSHASLKEAPTVIAGLLQDFAVHVP